MQEITWFFSPPLVMGLLAAALGLRLVIGKRPVIVPSRWMFAALVACVTPGLLASEVRLAGEMTTGTSVLLLVDATLLLGGAIVGWILVPGYSLLGVGDKELDAALRDALTRLQEPFEQTPDGVALTNQGIELKLREGLANAWYISVSPRGRRALLVALATAIRAYLEAHRTDRKQSVGHSLMWLGAFFLALAALDILVLRPWRFR